MKYRFITILLLCLIFLFAACGKEDDHTTNDTTLSSSESTDESSTPPPSDFQPDLPVWYIAEPSHLSYEDFFAEDRTLEYAYANDSWYVRQGEDLLQFGFDWMQSDKLVIQGGDINYTVPGSENLTGYTRLGTDGHYAYLHSDTEIIRVDLLSGEKEIILTCDKLLSINCYNSLVLIYLTKQTDACSISRMYLPTLETDLLYGGVPADTPMEWLYFPFTYSTQSPISWTMMNPEMTAQLQTELADPDSIYKVNSISQEDYTSRWGDPALISFPGLIWDIQTRSGIPAWVQCTFDTSDGSYTETTGIIDNCWVGSGYAHDHFDPQFYDVAPVWNVSEPVPIEDVLLPENPQSMYEEDVYTHIQSNYVYLDGSVYQQNEDNLLCYQFDIQLTAVQFAPDALYGITPDNALVQVSYDGKTLKRLYTAEDGTLSDLVYGSGKLYFLHNDTLMEIDIPEKTCRSLMDIPCFYGMYLDAPDKMFLETGKGLSVGMYVVDFSNLTIEDTHRL